MRQHSSEKNFQASLKKFPIKEGGELKVQQFIMPFAKGIFLENHLIDKCKM